MPPTIPTNRSARSHRRTRRLAALAAAGATLLAGATLATAGPAAADSVVNPALDNAVYTLQNQATGQVADDLNASTSAGNTIGQWPSKGGTNQQWTIVSSTGADAGYYTIQNDQGGMCLDVSGASTADGAPVIQWPCNGQDNQEWQINYTGSSNGAAPIATIVNKNSGKDLNVVGNADGAGLVQGSAVSYAASNGSGGYSNQWSLTRSTGGIPFLLSASKTNWSNINTSPTNELLEVPNSTTAWGAPVDLQPATGQDNQKWYLQAAGTVSLGGEGTVTEYRIINVYGNDWAGARCLEARGANPQDGAVVEQYGCDPNSINEPNQLWVIQGTFYSADPAVPSGGFLPPSTSFGAFDGASIYNVATLAQTDDTLDGLNSPMLTESSNIYPSGGSTMTIMSVNSSSSAGLPPTNDVWNLNEIETGQPSGASGTACSMFDCLINDV
jgi:hypothetical protein